MENKKHEQQYKFGKQLTFCEIEQSMFDKLATLS